MWHTKGSAGSAVGHGTRYLSITSPFVFSILGQQNHFVTDVWVTVPLYKYVPSVLSTELSIASSCSSTPGSPPDISLPWVKLVFSENIVMIKSRYMRELRCDDNRCSKSTCREDHISGHSYTIYSSQGLTTLSPSPRHSTPLHTGKSLARL